jgi:hypothetical protein
MSNINNNNNEENDNLDNILNTCLEEFFSNMNSNNTNPNNNNLPQNIFQFNNNQLDNLNISQNYNIKITIMTN